MFKFFNNYDDFFTHPSDADKQAFEAWKQHDDAENNFCEPEGNDLAFNLRIITGFQTILCFI